MTFLWYRRSVPTEDQILVPETLLKKRKSQEKQREERSAEIEKKKKVCIISHTPSLWLWMERMEHDGDDKDQPRD